MSLVNGHVEFGGYTIHVQAGIRPDPRGYDAPAAKYNDPTVVYDAGTAEANWQTIDCQVTRVTASHGGNIERIPGMRADLGRLTASLYDPTRQLDPVASPFQLLTKVGVPVRLIVVSPTGVVTPLWTGVAETWNHDLRIGTGQLVASDHRALIAGVDLGDWQRPAESAKTRLQAIVGFLPQPMTLVFTGTPASLSASKFSGTAWAAVANTGEAEQSIVWVDQLGRLRRSDITGFGTAIRATDCDDLTTPIIYTELSSRVDDEVMANIVLVERLNVPANLKERDPLQYADINSASQNGPHSLTATQLPLLDDAALANWANRVLSLRANSTPGVSGMSVTISDVLPWVRRTVPAIVGLSVANVLDIHLTSRGKAGQWVAAVAGITHTIVPDTWEVDIELADGAKIALNKGYDDPTSIYDTTKYSGSDGVKPSVAAIVAQILAAEEESNVLVRV
jgi:hypothetical protein